jgi:lysozyme
MNENLRAMLIRHEGYKKIAYICSGGYLTIGIGHNCDANPLPEDINQQMVLYGFITEGMIERLLEEDVEVAEKGCLKLYPDFDEFTQDRQDALTDFLFNVGLGSAKTFKNTNKAINEGRWEDAANGLRASAYAKQVGKRSVEIARMIEVG